jgi:hypothetical protein
VAVSVGVGVSVGVAVSVGVGVSVDVGVADAVLVGAGVGDFSADFVGVAVGQYVCERGGAGVAERVGVPAVLPSVVAGAGLVVADDDDGVVGAEVGVVEAGAEVGVVEVGVEAGVVEAGAEVGAVEVGVRVGVVGVGVSGAEVEVVGAGIGVLGVAVGVAEVGVGEGDGLGGAAGSCSGSQDWPLGAVAALATVLVAATARLAPDAAVSRTLPAISVTVVGRACAKRMKRPYPVLLVTATERLINHEAAS